MPWLFAFLLLPACGKTDSGVLVVRSDPRTGPIQVVGRHPRVEIPLPPGFERWDPPTAGNGFTPVGTVDRHPPIDDAR